MAAASHGSSRGRGTAEVGTPLQQDPGSSHPRATDVEANRESDWRLLLRGSASMISVESSRSGAFAISSSGANFLSEWLLTKIGDYAEEPHVRPLTEADRRKLDGICDENVAPLVKALKFLAGPCGNIDNRITEGLIVRNEANDDERSWFHVACGLGRVDIVRALVEHCGCDPEQVERDEEDWTPLHVAAAGGFREIAAFLLEHGADPRASNWDCDTPGFLAKRAGQKEVVELLKLLNPTIDTNREWGDESDHADKHMTGRIMPNGTRLKARHEGGEDTNRSIVEHIGYGSFAHVYKVLNHSTGRFEAVKVVRLVNTQGIQLRDAERVRRLKMATDEAQIMLELGDHPNTVTIRGINLLRNVCPDQGDKVEDNLYIFMDYVGNGTTLRELCGKIDIRSIARLMLDVACGLVHIEKVFQGTFIHKDIKPENVLVDHSDDGSMRAVIADFDDEGFTRTYASSRTAQREADPTQHQWSWAATTLAMILGKPKPKWAHGCKENMCGRAIDTLEEEMRKEGASKLKCACLALCRKCMQEHPEARCSMEDVVKELSSALKDDEDGMQREKMQELEVRTNLGKILSMQVTKSKNDYERSRVHFERARELARNLSKDEDTLLLASSHDNLAQLLKIQGHYDEAQALFEQSLVIRTKILGEEHPEVAKSLNDRAQLLRIQGHYHDAKPLFERALEIRWKSLDKDHPDVASSLFNLAITLDNQGNYDEAKQLYERSLEIRRESLGDDHPDVASSLNGLAMLLKTQGKYDEAKRLYERSLHIRCKSHGQDHPDVASSFFNLAMLSKTQGNYDEAKDLYERSLEIRTNFLGDDHPDVARTLDNLGGLLRIQGKHDEAKQFYECSLTILRKSLGEDHPDVARSLNDLAVLLEEQDNYDEAKRLYERSLEIRTKSLGEDHPDVAMSLNNLAVLLKKQGNYGDAERLYNRSLEIRIKSLGENHPDVAMSLNNLAVLLKNLGKNDEAKRLYERSLEIRRKSLGEDHPDVAASLYNLALLLETQCDYDEAKRLYERSLEIRTNSLGENSAEATRTCNNLALLLEKQGNYDDAKRLLERLLEIRTKSLGADHPDVASSRNNLARVLEKEGNYDEAKRLFESSLELRKKALGEAHPDVATSPENLEHLLVKEVQPVQPAPSWRSKSTAKFAMGNRGVDVDENKEATVRCIDDESARYEVEVGGEVLYVRAKQLRKINKETPAPAEGTPTYVDSVAGRARESVALSLEHGEDCMGTHCSVDNPGFLPEGQKPVVELLKEVQRSLDSTRETTDGFDPAGNERIMGHIMSNGTHLKARHEGGEDTNRSIVEHISYGSFGHVYKVLNNSTGRFEAVKVFPFVNNQGTPLEPAERLHLLKKATDEAQIMLSLGDHPNTVTVRGINLLRNVCPDRGNDAEDLCIFMDYVGNGTTLHHLCGTLGFSSIARLMLDVAFGLVHIENVFQGRFIHKDIKPENVLVDHGDDGSMRAVIADFDDEGYTLGYASSQTARREADPKQHQWSWATTMLAMIRGKKNPEWLGDGKDDICGRAIEILDVEMQKEGASKLKVACLALCRKCMKRNPEDRCSMEDVVRELSSALNDGKDDEAMKWGKMQELEMKTNLGKIRCMQVARSEDFEWSRVHLELLARDISKGEDCLSLASSLDNLATLLEKKLGKYNEAKVLFERALEIRIVSLGENHQDVAVSFSNLAWLLWKQGKFDAAKGLHDRSLRIQTKSFAEDHPDIARTLNGLGVVLWSQGKYDEAKQHCERSLKIREKHLGENHPKVAMSLDNLAFMTRSQGNFDEARPLYERSLEIQTISLGKNHPDIARALNGLGKLLWSQGEFDEAKKLCKRSLEIREKSLGENHPYVAMTLENLALFSGNQGKYDEAKTFIERALEIRRKSLGENHPDVAMSLNIVANLLEKQRKYDEAIPLYEQSLKILTKSFDGDHPDVKGIIQTSRECAMKSSAC